ncbi:MAG TPA: HD domain-containing phosphohydrolase [Abditibacteriaceae bacterium]|jgi:HD-GYP domain-containing protein (c-di-GMP phosphodiesterase class II)
MTQSQDLIRYLENNSLQLLESAVGDVRSSGGPSLQAISDDDLKVALYTVLLKIIDSLREFSGAPSEGNPDMRRIFLDQSRNLMEIIDGQSAYTTGHTAAVVRHSVQIASRLGLSDAEIDDIEYASWIHNIGLINQSQKLAMLPRALSQDELKQARNHTVVGADMIRPIEFLAHLVPIIRYHHHRFDGGNAPGELRGERLPLGARIISLADAYQAMLEPRAYRPALTREEALLEIDKGAGAQFDPKLVPLAHELS